MFSTAQIQNMLNATKKISRVASNASKYISSEAVYLGKAIKADPFEFITMTTSGITGGALLGIFAAFGIEFIDGIRLVDGIEHLPENMHLSIIPAITAGASLGLSGALYSIFADLKEKESITHKSKNRH